MKIKGLPAAQSYRASALANLLGVDVKAAKLLKLGKEVEAQTAPPAEYDGTVFEFLSVVEKTVEKTKKKREAVDGNIS